MKNWWVTQFARINTLSLRERVFLFLSVMACCLALVDVLWLSPAQVNHKQLTQRFDKQSAELQRLRDELKTVARPVDTSKVVRDEMAGIQLRLATTNAQIKAALPVTAQATPLEQALVHLLRRHDGLTLLHTTAVESEAAKAAALPMGLTRQGVELTVSGSYLDLMKYVQTLENELPGVRWGDMKLRSEKMPPELTLQLFLVGVQP